MVSDNPFFVALPVLLLVAGVALLLMPIRTRDHQLTEAFARYQSAYRLYQHRWFRVLLGSALTLFGALALQSFFA